MATKNQIDSMNLYCALMEEIKVRIEFVEKAAKGGLFIHTQLVRESCYLQLRLICELIALSCLTAHGDIKSTQDKSFQKEYAADKIIDRLERLHPHFYPLPVTLSTPGGKFHHLQPIGGDYLTKEELITLYGKSGDFVHRGSIRKLLKPKMLIEHTQDVWDWLKKVGALLSNHQVMLIDGKTVFVCTLKAAVLGGACQVAIAEAQEPPPDIQDAFARAGLK